MSEFDEREDFPSEDEPESDEPDPALVAFLDQETAAFNERMDEFVKLFGFEHHCTCAQDYTEGNTRETTHCFGRLCEEAMDACRRLKEERDFLMDVVKSVSRPVMREPSAEETKKFHDIANEEDRS